jgi:hypothetical protein
MAAGSGNQPLALGEDAAGQGIAKETEVIDKFRQIRQPRGGFPKQTSRVFCSPKRYRMLTIGAEVLTARG